MAKILLVEDEVNIASFIERGLKEFGHSVSVANDGDAGWELIRQEAFDLLILDIIMPKMNGLELCRLYRQQFHLFSAEEPSGGPHCLSGQPDLCGQHGDAGRGHEA